MYIIEPDEEQSARRRRVKTFIHLNPCPHKVRSAGLLFHCRRSHHTGIELAPTQADGLICDLLKLRGCEEFCGVAVPEPACGVPIPCMGLTAPLGGTGI